MGSPYEGAHRFSVGRWLGRALEGADLRVSLRDIRNGVGDVDAIWRVKSGARSDQVVAY